MRLPSAGDAQKRTVRVATAVLLALDLVAGAVDTGILGSLRNKVRGTIGGDVPEVAVGKRSEDDVSVVAAIERSRKEKRVLEIRYAD